MLKIRRYQPPDHATVCELPKTALLAAGAYIGGACDTDLDQIEAVYLDNGGEFLVGTLEDRVVAIFPLAAVGRVPRRGGLSQQPTACHFSLRRPRTLRASHTRTRI